MKFWTKTSRFILKNQIVILIAIAIVTVLLARQTQYIKFSYTEANLLPEDHVEIIKYDNFLEIFGEEGTLIILAVNNQKYLLLKNLKTGINLRKD